MSTGASSSLTGPQALCEVFAKNGVRTCSTLLLLHLGQ